MKIMSCNANRPLAEKIASCLETRLIRAEIKSFADREIFVEIKENVRGEDVFLIQPTSKPANDNLMELLIALDALRRGSARRITAVLPYFGYARQDRKTGPRTPISAKLVANLITEAGADRVLTLDLHAGQIQGFFDIPTDNLFGLPEFSKYLRREYDTRELLIVSPDVGGVVRARTMAKRLEVGLAIVDKRRERAGTSEVMNIIGDVAGKRCILHDDIVDSSGTMCNAAEALVKAGATGVTGCVTHGVLSSGALDRIMQSPMEKLLISDSIQATDDVANHPKIEQISIANLMARAIESISNNSSVSSLFN